MAQMLNENLNKADGFAKDFKSKTLTTDTQLEKMSQNVGEKIGTMASDVADTASKYVETSRDYVKENPGKSVAMAALAGAAFGSLFTFALRRRH